MADNDRHRGAYQRSHGRRPGQHQHQHGVPRPDPDHNMSSVEPFLGQADHERSSSIYQNMPEVFLMQECLESLGFGVGNGMQHPAKDSSATSGTLLSVGSSSVFADSGTGSLMEVHRKRTYSENSNRTSGGSSDGRHFSIPDEAEWNPAAEPITSVEPPEEDIVSAPHDPQYILSSMYNAQPRTCPDPYHSSVVTDDGEPCYYNSNHYAYQSGSRSYGSPPSVTLARVQNRMAGPWNHVDPQVSRYSPGYVAFAPSPGPAAAQYADEMLGVSFGAPSPSGSNRSGRSRERKKNHSKSPAKGKSKARLLGWEHTTVLNGGLTLVVENTEAPPHRSGVRRGKLDPEAAEKARKIRKLRACWNCWIQKIPCSEGETCDKCRRLSSPLADQLCCRAGFKDYVETFFPDYLTTHLNKRDIEDLVSKHTNGFTDTFLNVDVSTGRVFSPMTLRVNVFEPKTWGLLKHTRLTKARKEDDLQTVKSDSAPVGLLALELEEMKLACNKHIEDMVKNKQYAAQATAGDRGRLPCSILEIIVKYCVSKEVPLVQDALKLHAMHYFMGSLVTFSDESAADIYRSLLRDDTPPPESASRLLNRQLKYIMHKLHKELTAKVLKGLEKSLRSRTKDSWAPSFCTILILCLCIEGLQIAADTMVVFFQRQPGAELRYTRDQSYEACLALDEYPFHQCKKLFHEIYRTHKEWNGGARDGGFNPFRAVQDGTGTGLDADADEMVKSMYSMICTSTEKIMDLADRQLLIGFGETVEPQAIRDNNTGRLAAKFLRSFVVED